ncbi:MAG TPA: flagellar basal body protein [Anaerolineae bacterium]|nr:flagellar basal body protein [Anaerolineae bacterium]
MSNPSVESITTRALSLALDAASMRQRVIASNIANASTPGYAPQRVSFEAELAAADQGFALSARVEPAPVATGLTAGVQLDVEVAALAQNTVHQQVLLKALQRHMAMLATAVSEGKR